MTEATVVATPKAKKETDVEAVKMTDGRIVEFPGKRKLVKTSDEEHKVVVLDFRNGETRKFQPHKELIVKFMLHGVEQKLGDEIAGLDDIDDCVEAVDQLIERLNAGEWSVRRESSGLAGTSVLIRALLEAYPHRTVDQVREFLKEKTQAEKMALRTSKKLKPIIDKLEAEKASKAAKVDTAALLSELDAPAA
jgi:hypothetical protein